MMMIMMMYYLGAGSRVARRVFFKPRYTMDYINVRPKAEEYIQLNLPHGTKQRN